MESSFFAFKETLKRFIRIYGIFIKSREKGYIYVSKKYSSKIFEYLESDNDDLVEQLIHEGKATKYPTSKTIGLIVITGFLI